MNRYKDTLIQDKTLPVVHNFITLELVRRKFISGDDNDFEMYLYDALFEELLLRYDFKIVIVATNYVVSKMKKSNFCDENGDKIENRIAYFASSVRFNLKKLSGELYIDWFEED